MTIIPDSLSYIRVISSIIEPSAPGYPPEAYPEQKQAEELPAYPPGQQQAGYPMQQFPPQQQSAYPQQAYPPQQAHPPQTYPASFNQPGYPTQQQGGPILTSKAQNV